MKRALVISLGARCTVENYGAVLQILAFCEVLEKKYHIQVEILDYIGVCCRGYVDASFFPWFIFSNSKKGKIKRFLFGHLIRRRYKKNIEFLHEERSMTALYDYETINNASFDYDYYIAESDVIWDPSFRKGGFDDVFFLNKPAFENGKHYVFSAGIGEGNYTVEEKRQLSNLITKLDAWSAREKYAEEALGDIINCGPRVTLDPTLLVDDEFYRKYIRKRGLKKRKYILIYTPGYDNKKMVKDAIEYANRYSYKVYFVSRVPIIMRHCKCIVDASVSDFLTLLNGCEMLFCDSFHGVCLSIMLKKEFYVYKRADGKKIVDICSRLMLEDRIVNNSINQSKIDFKAVYNRLSEERIITKSFLDELFIDSSPNAFISGKPED